MIEVHEVVKCCTSLQGAGYISITITLLHQIYIYGCACSLVDMFSMHTNI